MAYLTYLRLNLDLCPPAYGHYKHRRFITQFVTAIGGILKLSPKTLINLAKTRTGRPLCGEESDDCVGVMIRYK